ncbi:MAG TPA: S49 family peptidase, partial [Polyangiaceae bacterium]|nr:S49 family peptidase [Polyangiaceae bacterium]
SAAYALAAATGNIEATHAAATFGSVGVVTSMFVDSRIVHLSSTDAPKKRPDPKTPEGQADIREHLDAVHDLFADAIASGRKTTKANVNQNFGRGAVVLAAEAKKRGMIDSIRSTPVKRTTSAKAQKGTLEMSSLSNLRASNRTLYDQFVAICGDDSAQVWAEIQSGAYQEAYDEAVLEERARCMRHLNAAQRAESRGAANAIRVAHQAIVDDEPFGEAWQAHYDALAAGDSESLPPRRKPMAAAPLDMAALVVAQMKARRGQVPDASSVEMPAAGAGEQWANGDDVVAAMRATRGAR